jgi:putative hydrolase of the HAD superfamily
MIKAFIFDIGNVLLPFDTSTALRRLRQKSDADSHASAIEPVKHAYESGGIGRAEFLMRMRELLEYEGSEAEFVSAWEDIFTENMAMSELVRRLHPRYPLFLLSNTSDMHVDHMFRTYPVFGLFKDAVYSYRVKCFKPERRIYEIAIEQFGVDARETVFIDDLPQNIEAALEVGLRAVHYDYHRHGDLLQTLAAIGVDPTGL